jgi:hypothetical protein
MAQGRVDTHFRYGHPAELCNGPSWAFYEVGVDVRRTEPILKCFLSGKQEFRLIFRRQLVLVEIPADGLDGIKIQKIGN